VFHPTGGAGYIQQPGSPGWPQQLWRVLTLMATLRMTSFTLRPNGIGTRRFRVKASGDGPFGRGAPGAPPLLSPGFPPPAGPDADAMIATGRLGAYASDDVEDPHMWAPSGPAMLGTCFAW
jgi:hypothetical protein